MKKKVIRLNEQEVENLVRKIIEEQGTSYDAEDIYNELIEVFPDNMMDDLINYYDYLSEPGGYEDVAKLIMDGLYTELTMDEVFGDGMVSFSEEDFLANWSEVQSIIKEMIPELIEDLQ